jgi:putative membrane protein
MAEHALSQNTAFKAANSDALRLKICLGLIALWFVNLVWSSAAPGTSPLAPAAVFLIVGFCVVHASIAYGWRGALTFAAVLYLVSFVTEALSINTGFPFGYFTHNGENRIRLFDLPIRIPLSYIFFGWLAWSQTRSLFKSFGGPTSGWLALIAVPVIAALIMAGYDYPMDPPGATVMKGFSYRDPSGQFGVPLVNFLGWIFTGLVAFGIFALLQRRIAPEPTASTGVASSPLYELLPPLIWLATALTYIPRYLAAPEGTTTVADRTFVISDVYEASVAVSLMSLVMPALITIAAIAARHEKRKAG